MFCYVSGMRLWFLRFLRFSSKAHHRHVWSYLIVSMCILILTSVNHQCRFIYVYLHLFLHVYMHEVPGRCLYTHTHTHLDAMVKNAGGAGNKGIPHLLWSDHICLLCFEHITSNVLNLLFAMFQTHYLLCSKHMLRYVLNTLFARLPRHSPALFQTRYLMYFKHISLLCVRHISLLCVRHIICDVLNTLSAMF